MFDAVQSSIDSDGGVEAVRAVTQADILSGLRELGLQSGDRVLVHSSMAALGQVEGGPDAVIEALIEAVGEEGMVVVPTFACKPPFDRRNSATPLGAIPDRLWRRPDAERSLHPTHSVAAVGKGAEKLIRDHEKAPTAYAEGTPYHTLATTGGKILLLGVDQDRNTTLHTAEALSGAPYLSDIKGSYIDDSGQRITIPVAAMAGPHRDFIGLDRILRDFGIVRIGTIGGAVCRLMDAGDMLQTAVGLLEADPTTVLCNNPACADCVMQRGKIKAARLRDESFTLAAVLGDVSDDIDEAIRVLQGEGISAVEVTSAEYRAHGHVLAGRKIKIAAIQAAPDDQSAAELAHGLNVPVIVPLNTHEDTENAIRLTRRGGARVLITNAGSPSSYYEEIYAKSPDAPHFAFNPREFASVGERPFLDVFYRGKLRKQMEHFYIDDGDFLDRWTPPGMGNGEVKEIISMLRCRSYDGVMTLRSPLGGAENFLRAARAFWTLLDTM